MIWEDKVKFRGKECPCPTYCPECVKDHYGHNEDAHLEFYLFVRPTQPGIAEAVCTRCGCIIPIRTRGQELS